MQLRLSPDDLRSCPSSDLLIQSGYASRHKETARESPEGFHFLAVCLAYRNPELYLLTLPRELPRQSNRRSKERVRNEDEEFLICKRRMTKELSLESESAFSLQCLFQNNLIFLFSAFFTENPFFLQAESFTIPTRSHQLKHQLQDKFLWNAIKEIPLWQCEQEKGGSGNSMEWWIEISPALPFSLLLGHAVIPPYLSWQERNCAAVWEQSRDWDWSMAADGERMWQDLTF